MPNIDGIIQELQQQRRIDQAIQALISLNGRTPKAAPARKMSASARRRIGAAQRARWAKQKSTQTAAGTVRRKRRISPAGIARIRAAAKARWAKVRAAKKVILGPKRISLRLGRGVAPLESSAVDRNGFSPVCQ